LDDDFASSAVLAARCKYAPGALDAKSTDTIAAVLLYVASARGDVTDSGFGAIGVILASVSQFEGRAAHEIVAAAKACLVAGEPALLARLRELPAFRDKTYALACEVAFANGFDAASERALVTLQRGDIPKSPQLVAMARVAFAAKYATAPAADAPGTAGDPLERVAFRALEDAKSLVTRGQVHFATLVAERRGEAIVRQAKTRYLPHSTDELKALLATELAGVERYAIAYPGVSFSLGGTVVVLEAADSSGPAGRRYEARYVASGGKEPSVGAIVPSGDCESLLFEPKCSDAVDFVVDEVRPAGGRTRATYACRLGDACFDLEVDAEQRIPGTMTTHGEGAIRFASAKDVVAILTRLSSGRCPPESPTRTAAGATVLLLSTNARRLESGFASQGGSWITSKWTIEDETGSVEVYVNLQPAMKRGHLAPREGGLLPVVDILERTLCGHVPV
jgi:hypothetical protein